MVVVSNETAAAGPLKQKAFQRAETLAPQRDHEFERSKLLSATLPLVTRMFLLGLHDGSDMQRIQGDHCLCPTEGIPTWLTPR